MLLKRLALVLMITAAFACKEKEEETPTTDSTPAADGSQTMDALAGDGQYCEVTTTLGGTYSVVHYLALTASGTYNYSLYLYDSASCSTSINSSGNNYATYFASGTYTLNGAANISTTGTKITFVPTTQSMVIRSGTYNARGSMLAGWMNTCSYAPGFSTSADDTKTLNRHVCTSGSGFASVDFPVNGASYTNVVYKTGTALQMGTPTGLTVWLPAGSSTPTSFTTIYAGW